MVRLVWPKQQQVSCILNITDPHKLCIDCLLHTCKLHSPLFLFFLMLLLETQLVSSFLLNLSILASALLFELGYFIPIQLAFFQSRSHLTFIQLIIDRICLHQVRLSDLEWLVRGTAASKLITLARIQWCSTLPDLLRVHLFNQPSKKYIDWIQLSFSRFKKYLV